MTKSKQIIFLLMLIILLPFFCTGCTGGENSSQIDYSVNMMPRLVSTGEAKDAVEVVSEVKSAVVGIYAQSYSGDSVGSGVCIADGGYILTNNHVIDGASKLTVYLANKDYANADIVWKDSSLDLALIKSEKSLPYLELSSVSSIEAGQDVIAFGTPLSLEFKHSVTKGIISAVGRTIELDDGYLQNLIQHDASINPGNSGGPLINMSGQVIGVNTLKASEAEGIGFAIPIDVIFPILSKLQSGKKIESASLGIYGFDASIANFSGQTLSEDGVYVLNVASNSNAGNSGIQEGDVITKFGDYNIVTMLDLRVALYYYSVGDSVSVKILRNNNIITINLNLN